MLGGLLDDNQLELEQKKSTSRVGIAEPYKPGDNALVGELLEDEEEEEKEPVKYFSDEFKEKLKQFRIQKAQKQEENKANTVESNLNGIFQNFRVVT